MKIFEREDGLFHTIEVLGNGDKKVSIPFVLGSDDFKRLINNNIPIEYLSESKKLELKKNKDTLNIIEIERAQTMRLIRSAILGDKIALEKLADLENEISKVRTDIA